MQPIQNMLKHYVPEVEDVRDSIDLEDRPGLDRRRQAILRSTITSTRRSLRMAGISL